MSDVFISYSHKDKLTAEKFAKLFESNGWSVFWDKQIPPGKSYDDFIKEKLDASRCIVVLWSGASVLSDWVKEEASRGISQSKLLPVLIEKIEPPLGFGRIEAAELYNWNGSKKDPDQQAELANLLEAIKIILTPSGGTDITPVSNSTPTRTERTSTGRNSSPDQAVPLSQSGYQRKYVTILTGLIAAGAAIAAATLFSLKEDSQPKISPRYSHTSNPTPTPRTTGTVSGESGSNGFKNLSSGPGTKYAVVQEIAIGEKVEVLGSSTDTGGFQWYHIRTSNGIEAWIAAHLITIP